MKFSDLNNRIKDEWAHRMIPYFRNLTSFSRPISGNCLPLGYHLESSQVRDMNQKFHEEFGLYLREALTEHTDEYRTNAEKEKNDQRKYKADHHNFDNMLLDVGLGVDSDALRQSLLEQKQNQIEEDSLHMAQTQFGHPDGGSWTRTPTLRPVKAFSRLIINTVAPTTPTTTTITKKTTTTSKPTTTSSTKTTTTTTTTSTTTTRTTKTTTTTIATTTTWPERSCPRLPDHDNWECSNEIPVRNVK